MTDKNLMTWYSKQFQDLDPVAQPNIEATKAVVDNIRTWLPPEFYPKIIDAGAGSCIITKVLAKYYDKVYAIDHKLPDDIDPNFSGSVKPKVIKEFYSLVHILGDIQFIANYFPKESMDGIILNHSFEHVYSPYIFWCEVFCLLREGGRLFINLPEYTGQFAGPNYNHPSVLDPDILKKIVTDIGFNILHMSFNEALFLDYLVILDRKPMAEINKNVKNVLQDRMRL